MWEFPKLFMDWTDNDYLGVSKNRGTPKWMAKIMENPIKMDDLGVPLFLETSICIQNNLGTSWDPKLIPLDRISQLHPHNSLPQFLPWHESARETKRTVCNANLKMTNKKVVDKNTKKNLRDVSSLEPFLGLWLVFKITLDSWTTCLKICLLEVSRLKKETSQKKVSTSKRNSIFLSSGQGFWTCYHPPSMWLNNETSRPFFCGRNWCLSYKLWFWWESKQCIQSLLWNDKKWET